VHKHCQDAAPRILEEFKPNLMIAIGGGGYVPARILRSFLKRDGSPNIPIQAIGLSLYEQLGGSGDSEVEVPGTKVTRTQWLDLSSLEMANLIGKNVLIVDEVDDTRTTLEYAVRELEKDVVEAQKKSGRTGEKTTFSIFVLHNKDKAKKGTLPEETLKGRYLAAQTVGDVWINYPWEAMYAPSRTQTVNHPADNTTVTSMSTTAWPPRPRRSPLKRFIRTTIPVKT
jgi:hypoxanthine phosphoribosyltransferase